MSGLALKLILQQQNKMAQKLSINIGLIRGSQRQTDSLLVTDLPSPTILSAKRHKSKIITRKSNEELIGQAYQELLSYVNTVDDRVQEIIQTHQGQFLQAYKQHMKRLRQELQEIKRKSVNNSHSEKVHLQKIDVLEKQLVIFREESMKLFQKIIKKDKQIENLQRKINYLERDYKQQEKSLYLLAKSKKQLEVQLEKTKKKVQQYEQKYEAVPQSQVRQCSLEQKRKSQVLTPLAKQLYGDFDERRPYTTNLRSQRSKNLSLRLQSAGKTESKQHQDLLWLKKRLEEKIGNQKMVEIQTVLNVLAQSKKADLGSVRFSSQEYNSARKKFMIKMETNRNKFISEKSNMRINSTEIRAENQLKSIFKKCVQEVRKDIVKRNNIPSLNFFKENGPKSYIQFKKMDHFNLLELFIKDQKVLKHLYQTVFNQNASQN